MYSKNESSNGYELNQNIKPSIIFFRIRLMFCQMPNDLNQPTQNRAAQTQE